jgi:preprotein translocase subunit SecF
MTSRPSSRFALSAQGLTPPESQKQSGMRFKAFLTTVMALLSVLVFGLGWERKNVFWLWIGFICALISGIFVQLFIDRKKKKENAADYP